MKKFLSSLLALTMILSLVIVPANAAVGDDKIAGVSMNTPTVTLKKYATQDVAFTYPTPPTVGGDITVNDVKVMYTGNFDVSVYSDDKNVAMPIFTSGSSKVTIQSVGEEGTANIYYTVSFDYQFNGTSGTATQTLTTKVTVEPEKPPVTYTYSVEGNVAVTSDATDDTVATGTEVTFTANTDDVKVYRTANTEGAEPEEVKTGVKFAYAWDGETATNSNTYKTTYTTTKASENKTAECVVTVSVDGTDFSQSLTKATKTITVTNQNAAAAQAAFEEAVTKAGFTYKGRATSLSGSVVTYKPYVGETASVSDFKLAKDISGFGTVTIAKKDDNGFAVSGTKDSSPVSMDFTFKASTAPSVTFTTTLTTGNVTAATVQKDGTITVTATASNITNPSYRWTVNGASGEGDAAKIVFDKDKYTKNKGTVTAICNVYENNDFTKPAAQSTFTLTVSDEACTLKVQPEKLTFAQTGSSGQQTLNAQLYKTEDNQQKKVTTGVTYDFKASDNSIVNLTATGGTAKVYLKKQGNATITVTATFEGKTYTETVEVKGALRSCKLESVENGGQIRYTRSELMSAAESAIYEYDRTNATVTGITVVVPSSTTYGTFYNDEDCGRTDKVTRPYTMASGDELYFQPINGYVGDDVKVTLNVTTRNDGDYTVTATIPVTMREVKFDDQVTGGESNYKVSVPDGYKAYWVLSSSKAPADTAYNDSWATKTSGKYSGSSLYSVKSTDLKDGEVKLYIVAIDSDGKAYSGTLTVTANSYNIKYNVVAGESVDFKQAHFEDFLDSAFKDQSSYSYKDYSAKFDYVKFSSVSSGSSTNGWQLYDGSSKVKTSDKIKDLDDISFSAGSKLTGTVKINFTLYADITKDSTGRTAKEDMPFSGTIEVTVIKEDIVYEVGVNSYVTFDSSVFLKYVQSAVNKNTKLDYVTFDVGKNGVISSVLRGTGALYASYSTYGSKIYAKSTDKFYYEPGKNQDALDSVTYATTSYAKAGDIVYIPFTAVTSAKKEVTGTVAIKVKQTMNFVDVHTYDYFYDAVQWAVNNDITKGTSTTTFSPKTGCTRAQIVTFLWRAAGSHEPRSSYNKFTDVTASHADYMKAIIWATEQGITTGTSATTFSPDATCTRAQIVTFLYRFKNTPPVYGSVSFSDVNKAEHGAYYNAILWASNNKIATGYNNIFNPNGTCNRGDAVTFLYRALA